MQRVPELEVLDRSDDVSIADTNSRKKQMIGMGLFALAGLCVMFFLLSPKKPVQKDFLDGDEEFRTTSFRAPSFLRDGPEPAPTPPSQNILKLPDPPAAPASIAVNEFDVPPPPTVSQAEAPALAPTEPARIEPPKEDPFPARFKSSQMVLDATKGTPASSQAGTDSKPTGSTDSHSQFLDSVSAANDRSALAHQIKRIDAIVPEGTLIPGILETAINSDLPGQIRAITSKDVYSFDGRRLLIPSGTRLIGEYQSELATGQTRVFIVWTRLIREDGVTVRLNSIGADSLGRAGVTGFVDKKFKERFGAALLLTIVGGVTDFVTGLGGSATGATATSDAQDAAAIARQKSAQAFSDMANQALADQLKIPPTIHINQGTRIFVYVRQDLDFSGLYKDPVEEELEAIKHERGLN